MEKPAVVVDNVSMKFNLSKEKVDSLKDYVIESRHLGLVTPDEVEGLQQKLSSLAKILEKNLDLDRLIALALER